MAFPMSPFTPGDVAAMQANVNPFQAQLDQLTKMMEQDQPQAGRAPQAGVNPFVNPAVAMSMALGGQGAQLLQGFSGVQAQEQARQDAFRQQQLQADNYRLLRAQRLGEEQARIGMAGLQQNARAEQERRAAVADERRFRLQSKATHANIENQRTDNARQAEANRIAAERFEFDKKRVMGQEEREANLSALGQLYTEAKFQFANGVLYDPSEKTTKVLSELPASERPAEVRKWRAGMQVLAQQAYGGLDAKLTYETSWLDDAINLEDGLNKDLGGPTEEPAEGTVEGAMQSVGQDEVLKGANAKKSSMPSVLPADVGKMSALSNVFDLQNWADAVDSTMADEAASDIAAGNQTSPRLREMNRVVGEQWFKKELLDRGRTWVLTDEGSSSALQLVGRIVDPETLLDSKARALETQRIIDELVVLGVWKTNAKKIAEKHVTKMFKDARAARDTELQVLGKVGPKG